MYKNQIDFLDKAVKLKSMSHAYLFHGVDDVEEIALDFIKKVNKEVCNKEGTPNILYIEPESNQIKIDQIKKELRTFIASTSMDNAYKIVLIRQAHYLNEQAQNSLLKSLEEPKGKVLFILITRYPDVLLDTVLSRCTKIFFPFLISNLTDEEKEYIKDIQELSEAELHKRFVYVKNIFKGKDSAEELNKAKDILRTWMFYFREILLDKTGVKKTEFKSDYSIKKITRIIKNIQKILVSLDFTNASNKMAFEIILLEL